jgi:hypothetical protein
MWAKYANTSTEQEHIYVTKNKTFHAEEEFYEKEVPGW